MRRAGELLERSGKVLLAVGVVAALVGAFFSPISDAVQLSIGGVIGVGIINLIVGGTICWFAKHR